MALHFSTSLVNTDDYAVEMTPVPKIKKIAAVGLAAVVMATLPGVASALSPAATDNADGVGFAPPLVPLNETQLIRNSGTGLGANVWTSGVSGRRPLFSEVVGFPADMPLLATVKVISDSDVTLSAFSGDDTTKTLTSPTPIPLVVKLATGLTTWYDVKELAFTGTQSAVNYALSLIYVKASEKLGNVKIKFAVTQDDGVAYNVDNDHFYKFVDWSLASSPDYVSSGAARTWTKALEDAAKITYKGVTGHLATVTSESENTFVRDRIGPARNVFLAGSDKDREGQWKWYAGPEAGQTFYEARCAAANTCNGEVTYNDRTPAVNTYSSWATSATKPDDPNDNEPNDWGAGVSNEEDYLVTNRYVTGATKQDPRWNDLPVGGSFIGGYVVEFSAALVNFKGVYAREMDIAVGPGYLSLYSRRTSDKLTTISGGIYGGREGDVIELERKIGSGAWKVIAKTTAIGHPYWRGGASAKFVDKTTNVMNVQKVQYRILMRNLPNLATEYRSREVTVDPIKLPPFASLSAKLQIAAGKHVSNLSPALFSGKGLKPFSKFKIVLRSDPIVLVDTTAGFDGAVSANMVLPDSIEAGDHTVTITGTDRDGKAITSVATFTLDENRVATVSKNSMTKSGTLPATGGNTGSLPWAALTLLVSGGALLAIRRKVRI